MDTLARTGLSRPLFPLALCALWLALGAAAPEATANESQGQVKGVFVQPEGEPNMVTTGISTASFTWGDDGYLGLAMYWDKDVNSMRFEGNNTLSIAPETPLTLGILEYYNGTTAPGTNAERVTLAITLQFDDGSSKTFEFPLQLINTPNRGIREEDADIVKFLNPSIENAITIDGTEYHLALAFGRTSEEGFSHIDQFFVYEGRTATAELRGTFTRQLPPPPQPVEAVAAKALASTATEAPPPPPPPQPEPAPEILISAPPAVPTTEPEVSVPEPTPPPQEPEAPPTDAEPLIQQPELEPLLTPEPLTEPLAEPTPELPTEDLLPATSTEPTPTETAPPPPPATDWQNPVIPPFQTEAPPPPAKTARHQGKLGKDTPAPMPKREDTPAPQPEPPPPPPPPPPATFAPVPVAPPAPAARPLPPPPILTVKQMRQISFETEIGFLYQLQASGDGEVWNNIGEPVKGDGRPAVRFRDTRDQSERLYRVRVLSETP